MISFNFNDEFMYIVEGEGRGGTAVVSRYDQSPLPPRTVENGVVLDYGALLKCAASRAEHFRFKRAVGAVAVQSTLITSTEYVLPYSNKKGELETMLKGELVQMTSAEDYVADYVVDEVFESEGAKCRLHLYLAPKSLIDPYEKLMRELGFKRQVFDTPHNCVVKLAGLSAERYKNTIIAYVDGKYIALFLINGDRNVVARRYTYEGGGGVEGGDAAVSELSAQIIKMVQFKQITFPGSTVSAVYICGDRAEEDVASQTAEITGIESKIIEAPSKLKHPPGFDFGRFIYAVGALIEES